MRYGKPAALQEVLFSQGFGTRRACWALVQGGLVEIPDAEGNFCICLEPGHQVAPEGLRFRVRGEEWLYRTHACLMLNKPAGVECSQKPSAWPSVYALLPLPLRQRPVKGRAPGVQAVGRLDQDTTGLLLFSDDGQFIHRMTSPGKKIPKVYEARCKHPVSGGMVQRLLSGVMLHGEVQPVSAVACEVLDDCTIRMTLCEGKYHQVKRMIAAAGNRVLALHRTKIGDLDLPPDLDVGAWRWLEPSSLLLPA